MTGLLGNSFQPMSRMTIGSLSDLGYSVSLDKADRFGPNAGPFLRGAQSPTTMERIKEDERLLLRTQRCILQEGTSKSDFAGDGHQSRENPKGLPFC